MKDLISKFIYYVRLHSFKIFISFILVLVFTFIRFPFSDLKFFVMNVLPQITGPQVRAEFDDLGLSFFPPGLKLIDSKVYFGTNSVQAKKAVIAPSPLHIFFLYGYIKGTATPYDYIKRGLTLYLHDSFGGDLDFSISGGHSSKEGSEPIEVDLDLKKLELSKLTKSISLFQLIAQSTGPDTAQFLGIPDPLIIQGDLNLESNINIDLKSIIEPKAELEISSKQITFPEISVLPSLKFSKFILKAKLDQGLLTIDNAKIGESSDQLECDIKGNLGLKLSGLSTINLGAINLEINLKANPDFEAKNALLFNFLTSYKKANGQYSFKISGSTVSTAKMQTM